jgi:lipopolysaccharide export system permease protein
MVLQIPTGATYCLPAGVVISTILVLIRMQRDSEILALQACGISFPRIMRPFLIMGLVGSLTVYGISEFVAPQLRYISSKLLIVGVCKSDRPFPTRWRVEIRNAKEEASQLLVLGRGHGRDINNFMLFDFTNPKIVNMVWASSAQWKDGAWDLKNGRIFELLQPKDPGVKGVFGHMTFGDGFAQMWKQIEKGPLESLDKTTAQLETEIKAFTQKHKPVPGSLMVQLYHRYSQPLNCLLLVLAGAPVAFLQSRRQSNLALGYAGLLIAVFFALQQTCLSFGEHGTINPALAAWLPATTLCFIGVSLSVLFHKKNRIDKDADLIF